MTKKFEKNLERKINGNELRTGRLISERVLNNLESRGFEYEGRIKANYGGHVKSYGKVKGVLIYRVNGSVHLLSEEIIGKRYKIIPNTLLNKNGQK